MDSVQAETLQRITRVETTVVNMDEKIDRAISANETATEALEKAKSAHKRLDKIDKIIFWLGTTVVGTILLAIIKLVTEGRS